MAAPELDPKMETALRAGMHEPAVRAAFGIEWDHLAAGDVRQRLLPPNWALRDGAGLAGVLALFADSTLGGAQSSLLPATRIPVTQSIRLDLLGRDHRPAADHLVAAARSVATSGPVLVAGGELASTDGTELAVATMRSVVIDLPRRSTERDQRSSPPAPTGAASAGPVPGWADALARPAGRLEVRTAPDMANAAGLVHGGVSMVVLEAAARATALERVTTVVPSTMSVDFVGPLRCDGSTFTCSATIAAARGSTLLVHAAARDERRRPAVVASLSYRISEE